MSSAVEEAVGGASERVQGLFRRAIKLYGLHPSDPDYGIYRRDDSPDCPVCRTHGQSTKKLSCDLELARANDLEQLGFEATFCHTCRQAFPAMLSSSLARPQCPACERVFGFSRRQDDGFGCVDRIHPSERAWDRRPTAAGKRAW